MIRILLDTNAFNNKSLLKQVKIHSFRGTIQAFVNPIIYLELGFIFRVRQKYYVFRKVLEESSITCAPLTISSADQASQLAITFKDDPRGPQYYFRDCLIGATALENDLILITNNKKDFPFLSDKLSPQEFITTLL